MEIVVVRLFRRAILTTLAGFFLFACGKPLPEKSLFDVVFDEKPVSLSIRTDFDLLTAGQKQEKWQPADIAFESASGEAYAFSGQVRPRGVFRKANCEFPPLKLKMEAKDLVQAGLRPCRSYKLVTHCREDYVYEQLLLKEFLAFKIYNILTDRSFRVQLANIRYEDQAADTAATERYGFLIEDNDELALRLGGRILDEGHGDPKTIDLPQYKIFILFQFMIGNTDWSLANRHNVVLIQPNETKVLMPFPVPYDFDFCGMVEAPYAIPPHHLPIASVRERFFQWRGSQDEDFTDTFHLFRSKKDTVLATVSRFELLSEHSRQDVAAYLETFFEMLDDPERIVKR